MKEKINLSGVPETMLQTIYARAKESSGRGVIHDTKAEEIIGKLDYDFTLAAMLLDFRFVEEHSLCEGMAVFAPVYKVLNKLPIVRNISNKLIVLEKV